MARDYEGMIEQQARNVERLISDPTSPWFGLPYDTVEQWTTNSPAGLNAAGWAPGREVSQQEAAQLLQNLNLPGVFQDGEGMTLESYLADPRSALKVENGKLVYRPEQMQGDFQSNDRESFLESLGALPFVLGAFGAPYLASLGAAGTAGGAGALNSFDTGAMGNILGTNVSDVATTASGIGNAASAAGTGVDFSSSFLPTLTETATAPGLVSPTGSLADMATTLGAGGAVEVGGLAGLTDAALGLPSGGLSAAIGGTGITVPGALGNLSLDAAGNLASTVVGGAAPNLATTVSGSGAGVTPGAVASGASSVSSLSKFLDGSASLDDWLKLGGTVGSALLSGYSSNKTADAFKDEASRLNAIQEPWRGRLSDMYANPSSFLTSAPVRASLDQGTQAVARALSGDYGNPAMSPNALAEINKYAANSLYSQFGNEANRLAAFGGLNFPATAGSSLNIQGANEGAGVYDAAQYALGQLTAPKPQMTVADMIKAINSGNLYSTAMGV